jgi:integrase
MAKRTAKGRDRQPNRAGSIYPDNDRGGWIAAVTVGYDEKGRPKRSKRRCKTEDEARLKLTDLHIEARTGHVPSPERLTLGDWLDRWQATRPKQLAASTKAYYRGVIEKHIKPVLGKRPLNQLTASEIEALYARMIVKKLQRYAGAAHATLRKAFNDALRMGVIASSPMVRVQAPAPPKRVEQFLEKKQILAFLTQLEKEPDEVRALGTLGICTGMRFGELLGVSWDDVDFEDRTLSVRLQLQRERKETKPKPAEGDETLPREKRKANLPARVPLKNTKSVRVLALSDEVVAALKGEQARQAISDFANPMRLVLLNPDGRPWDQKDASRKLKAVCKRAGVPEYGAHKLFRHSFITLLLKEGGTLHDTSRIAGHTDPRLTGALYGHHSVEATRRTMDAATKALRSLKEKQKDKRGECA